MDESIRCASISTEWISFAATQSLIPANKTVARGAAIHAFTLQLRCMEVQLPAAIVRHFNGAPLSFFFRVTLYDKVSEKLLFILVSWLVTYHQMPCLFVVVIVFSICMHLLILLDK